VATTLLESTNIDTTDRDKDMIHIFDPRNDGYALCGLRMTEEIFDDSDGEADCIVCEDLWQQWKFSGLY
jgi:hypothetical protein